LSNVRLWAILSPMRPAVKIRQIILAIGDVLVLYLSLILTLFFRYQALPSAAAINLHLRPFTIIFFFWILVFYIVGLYELRRLKNTLDFFKNFGTALGINTVISVLFFYLLTNYGIAPKTNLLIFLVVVFFLEYLWRGLYNRFISQPTAKILFIGEGQATKKLINVIHQNPQLGYRFEVCTDVDDVAAAIVEKKIDIMAVQTDLKKNQRLAAVIYNYLTSGVEVVDTIVLYENIFGKIPLSELEEFWFLENIIERHRIYDFFRLPLEILLAFVLVIILSPLLILIALLIKLTSRGPVLIKQKRVGELGKEFTFYKFRSMIANSPDGSAEADGIQWAKENDPRITILGTLLRRTHLDELPQLFNIIRGESSFVGPRPERPEFVEQLKKTVPFYELRHLVKPGITGWAQLNYRYGASVEDAYEKLQYDLYYLKNRSLWLDLGIIIKTIKMIFVRN